MLKRVDIKTPRVFLPLLEPSRYKGAWGGRGSGKSHFFAELLIDEALNNRGMRAVCIREVQKTLQESSKRLLSDKLQKLGLGEADGFKVFKTVIETPGDGIITFEGMQDHSAESIKSLEGYSRAWVEEAQTLSHRSLAMLRPTIRAANSELWFSWNPRRKSDAVDQMLRGALLPTGASVVKANWSDNPFFTLELEQERLDCLRITPEQYGHIWQGEYASVSAGAYWARDIAEAKMQGRICNVAPDPLMTYRVAVDIGGTGAKADAFTMWVYQFVGREIRILDYYESVGQPLATHLDWLRSGGYSPSKTQIWLPHDGSTQDKVFDVSYKSALEQAGYAVTIVPNQGAGAAKKRIEAARRLFPSMWFNASKCEAGLDALGWYHEKIDEHRNIGLGPDHDWSSHAADSFGLMCITYEPPSSSGIALSPIKYRHKPLA